MEIFPVLQKIINNLNVNISDNLIAELSNICVGQTISKGGAFIRAGETPKDIGIVIDGLFRYFYIDEDGKDFTKAFSGSGKILISYSAILQNRPSHFSIEALSNSKILTFNYKAFLSMMEKDIHWYPLAFKLIESVYVMKELREKSFLLDDATTRYKEFQEHYAEVENQIKLYHVASYLGITPEALSRIRKKMTQN